MTKIPSKFKKNNQNTPKTQQITEIPPKLKNYQNTPKIQKITKILLKSKNYENTPQTQKKKTKIPPKPKKLPKYLQNLKND